MEKGPSAQEPRERKSDVLEPTEVSQFIAAELTKDMNDTDRAEWLNHYSERFFEIFNEDPGGYAKQYMKNSKIVIDHFRQSLYH